MQCRAFQFNNPLAEDIIFLVYTVTNVSEKDLDRVYFGMFGDPHVGGGADYADDYADFNGQPDQGEINFGFKDIAESDQIGLASFNALIFGGENRPNNDELMWGKITSGLGDTTQVIQVELKPGRLPKRLVVSLATQKPTT